MADLFPSKCAALGISACLPDIFPAHREICCCVIGGGPADDHTTSHDMMTTFRTHFAALTFALLSLSTSGRAHAGRPSRPPAGDAITISMTADHWQTKENAEFLRQLGFYHGLMRLNSGTAVLKGTTFSDGTIEFDVNTIGRGSPGIAFRQQDEETLSCCISGPIRRVRLSWRACSMHPRRMASCCGTCFRNTKRGRHSERTGGTTSRWSCPAGG